MTDSAALMTLTQWLSPAFPVGAFAYSHGLEWSVAAGDVGDAETLEAWLGDILRFGAGAADATLLAAAHRRERPPGTLADLARAYAASRERRLEMDQQGAAFAATLTAIGPHPVPPLPYAVAVGHAARLHGLPLDLTARLYLQAFAGNLVSAAIRLVPIGQTDGQAVLAALAPVCVEVADAALAQSPDDIASSTICADIASMKHETQAPRLFRS